MSPSGSGTGSVCRCPAGALPPALEVESVCVCARTHGSTRTPTHLRARDTHTLLNITIFNPVLSLLKLCLEQYFRPEMESGLRFGPVLNDVVWTAPSLVCVGGRMGAFPWVLPAQWQSWFASGCAGRWPGCWARTAVDVGAPQRPQPCSGASETEASLVVTVPNPIFQSLWNSEGRRC